MSTVIEVQGLLKNGTEFALGVPRAVEHPLTVQYRQLTTIRVRVIASNGVRVNLDPSNPAHYLMFSIRANAEASPLIRLVGQKVPQRGGNVSEFAVGSNVWSRIKPRMYRYDVWMIRGTDQDIVVPYSYFKVEPGLGTGPITPDPIPPVQNGWDFGDEG